MRRLKTGLYCMTDSRGMVKVYTEREYNDMQEQNRQLKTILIATLFFTALFSIMGCLYGIR